MVLAGACKPDAAAFCKDVTAGEGRLAACLTKRIKEAKKGNVAGRKVSDKCADDIAKYKIDRSTNINKDLALGEHTTWFWGVEVRVIAVRSAAMQAVQLSLSC